MNIMATNASQIRISHQMFKCYNCGRKTVSLGDNIFVTELELKTVEDDDLDKQSVLESLEFLSDEWLASCKYCGWSDS